MIKIINNEFIKVKRSKLLLSQIVFLIIICIIKKYSNKFLLDSIYSLIPFIGMMTCIIYSGTICGEIENGTIKYYLTKPYKRWKIYLAKLLCIYLYLTLTILIIIAFSFLITNFFELKYIIKYFVYSIPNYFIATFSLYLSAKFKNQSLCVGISIFVLSFSLIISQILFGYKFNIIEYTFLPYLDFSIFKDKRAIDMMNRELNINLNINKAIVMNAIYTIIFYFVGNYKFNKKDIKN